MSAGTQHRRQREVKAFFSRCLRLDYVEENPFMRVPMVPREQKWAGRTVRQPGQDTLGQIRESPAYSLIIYHPCRRRGGIVNE